MEIVEKIDKLYTELPSVGCIGCGHCCVSPTATLSEFIYLFNYIKNSFSYNDIVRFLQKPVELHPEYDGNSRCIFLENSKCSVHQGRPGACRLFGIPSLLEMGIANMEECRNSITITSGRGDLPYIQQWLNSLFTFERSLYPFCDDGYAIRGFNISTWLDIFFDDRIDNETFKTIKDIISSETNLDEFKSIYSLQTNINEKIIKIERFNSIIGTAGSDELKSMLLSIRDDYQFTGTYFYEEANMYLDEINRLELNS